MPAFVALFRAVNVGGRSNVAMRDLRGTAARLGLGEPRTLLQSGNLVFSAESGDADTLEPALETAARTDLGLDTAVLVRAATAWSDIVEHCPFPQLALTAPSRLLVMTLRRPPSQEAEAALRDAIAGREDVVLRGTTAYLFYPDGIGRSKLTAAVIERRLETVGTARNWNTVLRIAAALAA